MVSTISSIGLQLLTTSNLLNQQNTLATLNEQLGSGVQHNSLTDYAPVDARNILDFQSSITQKKAYIAGMQTVNTRLSIYDSTMTDIESLTEQAQTLASQNQTYDPTQVSQIKAQVQSYLKQVQDDLNQKVGDRYIYSGSRYSTAPVVDLTTLAAPTLPFTAATTPTLTDYDTEYNPPTTTTDAAAYAQDSVTIDTSYTVKYGVTSNDTGFQQVIAGLRLLNAAASQTDPTVYKTNVAAATDLLNKGLANVQATHASVAGNTNLLAQETSLQNTDITNLQNQLGNIQQVDMTTVGTEINQLTTQLQASYSATASIIQDSILKYL